MSDGAPALASVGVFPSSNVPTPSSYVVSVAGGACIDSYLGTFIRDHWSAERKLMSVLL